MTLSDTCGDRAAMSGPAQQGDGSIGADLIHVTTKLQQVKMRGAGNANSQTLAVAANVDKRDLPAEEAIGRVRRLD